MCYVKTKRNWAYKFSTFLRYFRDISFQIYSETLPLSHLKKRVMFQQYIGSGANIFIAIVAVIIGFAAAMGYTDFLKTTKKEEKKD